MNCNIEIIVIGRHVVMPPTLKKWGTYWFRLVRMYVCVCACVRACVRVCVRVFMFEISS